MKYLVKGEYIDPGALLPPAQVVELIEGIVFPSLERLQEWNQKGKISGGLLTGERAGVFVIDAANNEELDRLLLELPMWGILKWTVTPLTSWGDRMKSEHAALDRLKASATG